MIYVMSDLHGQEEKYFAMLEKISFGENDTLYLLGDYIDRGAGGVKILLDLMKRPNAVPLLGNHERKMICLICHKKSLLERYGRDKVAEKYREWFSDGGQTTYYALRELEKEKREELFAFVRGMNYTAELTVEGQKYFLSHTLPGFSKEISLRHRPATDFLYGEPDYGLTYLPDTVTVTGHTPTSLIDPAFRGRIWRGNRHIAVDCGAFFTGTLGCLCLNTGEEFYVTE